MKKHVCMILVCAVSTVGVTGCIAEQDGDAAVSPTEAEMLGESAQADWLGAGVGGVGGLVLGAGVGAVTVGLAGAAGGGVVGFCGGGPLGAAAGAGFGSAAGMGLGGVAGGAAGLAGGAYYGGTHWDLWPWP